MMSAVTSPTARPFHYRPRLQAKDRLISRRGNEQIYAPTSILPEEITLTISSETIELRFSYPIREVAQSIVQDNFAIERGVHTGKLLRVATNYQAQNAQDLRNQLNVISEAVKQLAQRNASRDVIKESYKIIARLIDEMVIKSLSLDSLTQVVEGVRREQVA